MMLYVPYIHQTGCEIAADCGPACLAMAIHFLTDDRPGVCDVARATGAERNAQGTTMQHLANAASQWGISLTRKYLTIETIKHEIDLGYPVLTLAQYDKLTTKADPNEDTEFRGLHWLIIVGYTRTQCLYHDPHHPHGQCRRATWQGLINATAPAKRIALTIEV